VKRKGINFSEELAFLPETWYNIFAINNFTVSFSHFYFIISRT